MKRPPLRKIISRLDGAWITRETLECGHVVTPHGMLTAKSRRCKECAR